MSRSELYGALFVALTLNGFANRIAAALSQSDLAIAGGLFGLNAVVLFACFAMVKLALDDAARDRLGGWDYAVAAVGLVCVLVPLKAVSALALPALAVFTLLRSESGTSLNRIALVALALSGSVFFGPTIMAFAGADLTRIETALVPLFTGLETDGNVLFAASGGETFVVASGCSAFANVTLGIVAVVAFWQAFECRSTYRMLGWCAAAALAVIIINTLRLSLIGLFPSSFVYLHDGGGADLFMWATEIAVIAIAAIGVMRAQAD